MCKSKTKHPWRTYVPGGQGVDPIAKTRSPQFAAFLETLPAAERQQIVLAERAFVSEAILDSSPQQSTARDFNRGMLGVKEYEPVRHRGFVV